jgi:hypothetical protein
VPRSEATQWGWLLLQMATVLLTGSGVAWQLFCSLWGSLPFRVALPQQAAITIMLLLFNRQLCSTNLAIQLAYASLAQRAHSVAAWLAPAWIVQIYRQLDATLQLQASFPVMPSLARNATGSELDSCPPIDRTGASSLQAPLPQSAAAVGAQLCLQWQPARWAG